MTYLVNMIKLPLDYVGGDAFEEAKKRLRTIHALPSDAVFSMYRRSVDARRRDRVHFVVSVAVSGSFRPIPDEICRRNGISLRDETYPIPAKPGKRLKERPVVIGSGPAGLFAALQLAENGYAPIVLERGGSVRERVEAHRAFREGRRLDSETNIQYGAGGAGTFSDGKLVTRISDPVTTLVLRQFVSFGAPEEILWQAKPHIGTDLLRGVIDAMCTRLTELGGEIRYHTKATRLLSENGHIRSVLTSCGEIPCGAVILAVGNSANDTYRSLLADGFCMEAKPFSVGVRIEHLQSAIDTAMYGSFAGHPALGHAEYHLSCDTASRGVYTFCMCPGGEVVAAASEENIVVVNGMSEHKRDGVNANSAIAVSVFPGDFGATPEGAIRYREVLERAAFQAGGGKYRAPAVTVGAFLGTGADQFSRVTPSYLGGDVTHAMPETYLPPVICDGLRRGITAFGRMLSGFDAPDAVLTGVETRTSAPVRIVRTEERLAIGYDNLFPCGEGAGYAGGITSSAADGYRSAIALRSLFAPVS